MCWYINIYVILIFLKDDEDVELMSDRVNPFYILYNPFQEDYLPESESDEEDDFVDELPVVLSKDRKPRMSVSAEVFGAHNRREDYKPRVIPKSDETKKRIKERMA